ncbi:putative peroxygenase 3 [Colletotrichum siamense]|uniref:putative peroxygenase 3 n=1 Tax=Colletotrichum siamense TaxID=690259 RepID=UPI0018727C1F|nr:putative peroxygenase 3 [Colletotrichum siamense]KAF5497732.1 putative peroxygenase 3 [Colletotrichum siamense]
MATEGQMYTNMKKASNMLGEPVISSISEVPITTQRKPFLQPEDDQRLSHTGTARANIAATHDRPNGTTEYDWNKIHRHQTVLQQHCEFFDRDQDGVIWPLDTFVGFYKLGFGLILSTLSVFIIHGNFSYPTVRGYLPDPFFRIFIDNVHRDKHGSDSGAYDTEGRFSSQKFEDIFAKYAEGRDYMTIGDIFAMLKGNRVILDPVGWGGAFFEWMATYIMLWPADGRIWKEDVRGIYDGSLFYTIAARRSQKKDVQSKHN